MANEFNLHIRSVDRDFYEGKCVSLTLTLPDGQQGLMANHSAMVAAVIPGLLSYRLADGTTVVAAAGSGMARFENNDALVLLDSIERPEDIDASRARAAVDRAREALLHAVTKQEKLQAKIDLDRALNRLKAVEEDMES